MRLHRLLVTAFGPFADTVEVDFDGLSEGGLFLLAGPTGAGKSSVLDAVCFALYGDVPGDRSTAKRLRCDQAGPDVAPTVVARSMRDAVRLAFEAARPGGTVVLAPACASFDMFADFAERGRRFKEEVAQLAAERRAAGEP